ncbi:MAG: hypothetical protein LW625_10065 [Planctomycetaceae bacterium]|nr:hypothetical protein [Planctomycetaceae bacterium]
MRSILAAGIGALSLCALLGLQAAQQTPPVRVLPAAAYAKALVDFASAAELRRYHDLIAMEPHVAGTVGDVRQIERIKQAFEAMNLATRVERFRCLLSRPISASLEMVDDGAEPAAAPAAAPSPRRGVVSLPINERNLLEDPATAHPDLSYGWNAYSGNGDVTAPVVYANYATREDFAKLKELGVDVKGKIVIARYGKCFRGYKARFAQEVGAAGLIIYTDPGDSGFSKGKVWPDGGGWANDLCIQRGTLNTLPYPGDPGTPGVFSSDSVVRDDPAKLDLPTIPVQPIGYAAAGQILARFKGADHACAQHRVRGVGRRGIRHHRQHRVGGSARRRDAHERGGVRESGHGRDGPESRHVALARSGSRCARRRGDGAGGRRADGDRVGAHAATLRGPPAVRTARRRQRPHQLRVPLGHPQHQHGRGRFRGNQLPQQLRHGELVSRGGG